MRLVMEKKIQRSFYWGLCVEVQIHAHEAETGRLSFMDQPVLHTDTSF